MNVNAPRFPIARIAGAFATFAALLTGSSMAPAQAEAQGWYDWQRPSRIRPFPPSYDDYDSYEVPRAYERRRWYRRYGRGFDPYEDQGDGGWDTPGERRAARPSMRDEDDYDRDETDGGASRKPAGVTEGARAVIAPKAPPIVAFSAAYKPGSIVIDTSARKLYYVRGHMSAFAYPIGVGRDGFSWTGKEKVSRIADWPDWYPPAEMRKRKPELPERMLGGLNNPLGAKAIYLGNTLYRIHGTNDPKSIGRAESSGCFRMLNANVMHLALLVSVGTEVTVVRALGRGAVTADARSEVAPEVAAKPRAGMPARPSSPPIQWGADTDPDPTYADDDMVR